MKLIISYSQLPVPALSMMSQLHEQLPKRIQNLFVLLKDDKQAAVDWLRFE